MTRKVSIILPARNEAAGLAQLLPELSNKYPDAEIIVVDDGSTDDTTALCQQHHVRLLRQMYGMGNGAAIKSGARSARGDVLVFMDADGQHDPGDIERLLAKLDEGFDMVVGARDRVSHANLGRWWANALYNRFASWIVGHAISDLTSGFRVAVADKFKELLHLLPNGFSYPTSITMAFFRAGYFVTYVPVQTRQRLGTSHIRPLRDGIRFLIIIFKIGTLYAPLKIFLPVSFAFFLTGSAYYAYTYMAYSRFTNMSALLFIIAVIVFLIGLISEQVTTLVYGQKVK
ncbi:MAG: glycosyltransferase family 2 protein [Gammaproteobacteria bacterium]|nr:glycosyltransferase family 2 protein [Gammaproteobacteria bacterium]MCI0590727.1 glycosyltransferase family 2 protein [Gammaproteobacteria bacterium]